LEPFAFGDDTDGIVEGRTDGTPDKMGSEAPWRERTEAYIAGLGHEPGTVLLVSAADRLHNARPLVADRRVIGDKVRRRFNAPKDDILWCYGSGVGAFRANPAHHVALVDELDRVAREIRRLANPTGPAAAR
jgi:hypothetical protein